MYIVHILFTTKPDIPQFQQTLQECIALAKPQSGCLSYGFFADQSKENTYLMYEEWEKKQAYEDFKSLPVFKEIGDKLTPLLAGAPVYTYFSTEDST